MTQPRKDRATGRRRSRWSLAAVASAALIAAGFGAARLYAWWNSPERAIARFIGANNARDMAAVIELLDPVEVKHFGLTKAKCAAMLRDSAGTAYIPRMVGGVYLPAYELTGTALTRTVELVDPAGHSIGGSAITVVRSALGWRPVFTNIILSTTSKGGARFHKYTYYDLAAVDHFPSETYDPLTGGFEKVHKPLHPAQPVPP